MHVLQCGTTLILKKIYPIFYLIPGNTSEYWSPIAAAGDKRGCRVTIVKKVDPERDCGILTLYRCEKCRGSFTIDSTSMFLCVFRKRQRLHQMYHWLKWYFDTIIPNLQYESNANWSFLLPDIWWQFITFASRFVYVFHIFLNAVY